MAKYTKIQAQIKHATKSQRIDPGCSRPLLIWSTLFLNRNSSLVISNFYINFINDQMNLLEKFLGWCSWMNRSGQVMYNSFWKPTICCRPPKHGKCRFVLAQIVSNWLDQHLLNTSTNLQTYANNRAMAFPVEMLRTGNK